MLDATWIGENSYSLYSLFMRYGSRYMAYTFYGNDGKKGKHITSLQLLTGNIKEKQIIIMLKYLLIQNFSTYYALNKTINGPNPSLNSFVRPQNYLK